MATIELKIPQALASECQNEACPDTWDQCVTSATSKGKFEVVRLKDEDADSFLQAMYSAADIAMEYDRAQGKRWKKQTIKLIRDVKALGVATPWCNSYLSLDG